MKYVDNYNYILLDVQYIKLMVSGVPTNATGDIFHESQF